MENRVDLSQILFKWQFYTQLLIGTFMNVLIFGHFVFVPDSLNVFGITIAITSLILWIASFSKPNHRYTLQTTAICVALLMPLSFGDEIDVTWIPLGYILFGLLFLTAFSKPPTYSYKVILIVTTVHFYLTISTEQPVMDDGLSWIYNLILATTLTFIFNRAFTRATEIEARFVALRNEVTEREQRKAVAESELAVKRQVHETLLNTLSVLSGGVKTEQLSLAKATIERDLEIIQSSVYEVKAATLHECVAEAITRSEISINDVSVSIWPDKEFSPTIAGVLTDVITEALRNVERHAKATAVRIEAEVTDNIRIAIFDNGIGIPDSTAEQFGIRNTIKQSITSLGGSAEISANSPSGIKVTIELPLSAKGSEKVLPPRSSSIVDQDVLTRAGTQLGTVFIFLVTLESFNLANNFDFLLGSTGTLLGISLALIIFWNYRFREIFAFIGFSLQIFNEHLLMSSNPYCENIGLVQWTVNANGFSSILFLLAFKSIKTKIALFALSRLAPLIFVAYLPSECRAYPLGTAIAMVFFVGLFLAVLIWGMQRLDRQIADNQALWEQIIEENIQQLAVETRRTKWNEVSNEIRDFLAALHANPKALLTPETRRFAAQYAGEIRNLLGGTPGKVNSYSGSLDFLKDLQAQNTLNIDASDLPIESDIPNLNIEVQEFLKNLVLQLETDSIRIRMFEFDGESSLIFKIQSNKNLKFAFESLNNDLPKNLTLDFDSEQNAVLVEVQN
ncbi:MAG: hypothetical protein RL038_266 [Actinomycetota bacterium]